MIRPTMGDNGSQVDIAVKDQQDCFGNEIPGNMEVYIATYVAAEDLINPRNQERKEHLKGL